MNNLNDVVSQARPMPPCAKPTFRSQSVGRRARHHVPDTLGNCTVADGLLLPSMASALVLPFQKDGRAATADEVVAEYNRVMGMPKGMIAAHYANSNSPRLSLAECTDLLRPVVNSRIAELTRLVKCFASSASSGALRCSTWLQPGHARSADQVPH